MSNAKADVNVNYILGPCYSLYTAFCGLARDAAIVTVDAVDMHSGICLQCSQGVLCFGNNLHAGSDCACLT